MEAEIVGHWDWSDLADNEKWYQEIIIPAFENFTATTSRADSTNSPMAGFGTECAKEDMDDLPKLVRRECAKRSTIYLGTSHI